MDKVEVQVKGMTIVCITIVLLCVALLLIAVNAGVGRLVHSNTAVCDKTSRVEATTTIADADSRMALVGTAVDHLTYNVISTFSNVNIRLEQDERALLALRDMGIVLKAMCDETRGRLDILEKVHSDHGTNYTESKP